MVEERRIFPRLLDEVDVFLRRAARWRAPPILYPWITETLACPQAVAGVADALAADVCHTSRSLGQQQQTAGAAPPSDNARPRRERVTAAGCSLEHRERLVGACAAECAGSARLAEAGPPSAGAGGELQRTQAGEAARAGEAGQGEEAAWLQDARRGRAFLSLQVRPAPQLKGPTPLRRERADCRVGVGPWTHPLSSNEGICLEDTASK